MIPLNAKPSAGFRFSDWSPNVTNPADIATTVFMDTSKTVTVNFVACACATDVSNSIGVTLRDPPDSPITQDVHLVTLTNNSPATIRGPISLVLDNLTENVTLSNASGSTILMLPADSGYVNAPVPQLAPGHSTTFPLLFVNPDNVPITYTTRVLTGPGSR